MDKETYRTKTPFAVAMLIHLMEKEKCRSVVVHLLDKFKLRIVETDFDPYFNLLQTNKRRKRNEA